MIKNSNHNVTSLSALLKYIQEGVRSWWKHKFPKESSSASNIPDTLGFSSADTSLINLIVNIQPPVSIGIYGSWGSGKTEMLKRVLPALENAGCPTLLFDAWQAKDEKSLFGMLLEAYKKKHPLRSCVLIAVLFILFIMTLLLTVFEKPILFIAYAWWVSLATAVFVGLTFKQLLDFFNFLGPVVSFLKNKKRKHTPYDAIENIKKIFRDHIKQSFKYPNIQIQNLESIQGVGTERHVPPGLKPAEHKISPIKNRAVIAIDNLDRCMPQKIVELIEDISTYFNVDNCIFLLVMDRSNVISAIESVHKGMDARAYLEKIVVAGFDIPYPNNQRSTKYNLYDYFVTRYEATYERLWGKKPPQVKAEWFFKSFLANEFIANPRRMNRLADNFARINLPDESLREGDAVAVIIVLTLKEFCRDFYIQGMFDAGKLSEGLISCMSLAQDFNRSPLRIKEGLNAGKNEVRFNSDLLNKWYLNSDIFYQLLKAARISHVLDTVEDWKGSAEQDKRMRYSECLRNAFILTETIG